MMIKRRYLLWLMLLVCIVACGNNETAVAEIVIDRPTLTPSATVPPTATLTPSLTPSITPTPTKTPTPSHTPTPIPTNTPTQTPTPIPTNTPTIVPTVDVGPEIIDFGRSVRGQTLEMERFGAGNRTIVFIGGVHSGFAPASVSVADNLRRHLRDDLAAISAELTIYVVSNLNVDSPRSVGNLAGRLNANGVDLNRNWDCDWSPNPRFRGDPIPGAGGSEPFSEPEALALAQFLLEVEPDAVVVWGARFPDGFVSPGACVSGSRSSVPLALAYARGAGYDVDDYETETGQIIHGDLTNWLDAQGIPAISVLLPDYTDADWQANLRGILQVLRDAE